MVNYLRFFPEKRSKLNEKRVPLPSVEEKSIFPLCSSTTFFVIANPRPVPLDFVLKFGTNIEWILLSSIPSPLSEISTLAL